MPKLFAQKMKFMLALRWVSDIDFLHVAELHF